MRQDIYQDSSTTTGPLQPRKVLGFRRSLTKRQRLSVVGFITLILTTSFAFIGYLLHSMVFTTVSPLLVITLGSLLLIELIRIIQGVTLGLFALAAKDPIPMLPRPDLRIAVLTTIVPSKEPFPLVAQTLKAMKAIRATPGAKVDVWLLDEGNQPAIRKRCENLGVKYFSRQGLEGWNRPEGAYRAHSKHGNHNAWRRAYEHRYDIVTHLDPDHVPFPSYLERTLGYFTDQDVGYVVAPQLYGNLKQSWIARAAAVQAYVFHGIIQRGGNGLQAPLFVGTNHLYRVKAFQQIHGYQDSIIEDHLTSMVISGATKADGTHWKGVYTPDIIAVGEGPTSFTDYFNQQKRWAYGIWDIALRSTSNHIRQLTKRQAAMFVMLQFFYPSVAISWVLSSIATLLFAFAPFNYHNVGSVVTVLWAYSLLSSLSLFFWLRQFNLIDHERKTWGIGGMALTMMCIPVYVSAAFWAVLRKPLNFAVTAKGDLTSPDSWRTFRPHLLWLGLSAGSLALLAVCQRPFTINDIWLGEHMVLCLTPLSIFGWGRLATKYHRLRTKLGRSISWHSALDAPISKEATS